MADSSLVVYEKYTNNCTKMTNKVNNYIIPHVYVGQVSTVNGVNHFNTNCNASCQYVIGTDGTVGQCVREDARSWCTGGSMIVNGYSGSKIDYESITFEMACDATAPYALNSNVRATLVKLMADCAKRNNMGELKWRADKSLVGHPELQNVCAHRWWANKSCPGDWTYNQMGTIVDEANALNGYTTNYKQYDKGYASGVAKPTLYKGCRGSNTKLLQQNLMAVGISLPKYGADGDFGDETRSGVLSFQKMVFPNNSKEWDGIYGQKSYTAMLKCFQ